MKWTAAINVWRFYRICQDQQWLPTLTGRRCKSWQIAQAHLAHDPRSMGTTMRSRLVWPVTSIQQWVDSSAQLRPEPDLMRLRSLPQVSTTSLSARAAWTKEAPEKPWKFGLGQGWAAASPLEDVRQKPNAANASPSLLGPTIPHHNNRGRAMQLAAIPEPGLCRAQGRSYGSDGKAPGKLLQLFKKSERYSLLLTHSITRKVSKTISKQMPKNWKPTGPFLKPPYVIHMFLSFLGRAPFVADIHRKVRVLAARKGSQVSHHWWRTQQLSWSFCTRNSTSQCSRPCTRSHLADTGSICGGVEMT